MKFTSKKVAIIGLGMEGIDLVNYLTKEGAEITICDKKQKHELDLSGVKNGDSLLFNCGETYLDNLKEFDYVFRSPGIYRYKDELVDAEKHGAKISSAIKLFFDRCPAKIVGVTGTKGKGTTSTLTFEMLKKAGEDVYLAGNIGKPYLELLPKLTSKSVVVMEMSSFQLIDLHKSPNISVVLNITTDHLDWHKDRNEYLNAKKNIVAHQSDKDLAVLNIDYLDSKSFGRFTKAKVVYFSRQNEVHGVYVKNNTIVANLDNFSGVVGDTNKLLLRGEHNWENITASIAVALSSGVDIEVVREVVLNFKGLEHRLELVRNINEIAYYNDSFATGPDSVKAAISSFTEPVTLILGGFDKGLDYDELSEFIEKIGNVKTIVLIGDIADKINKSLNKANYSGNIEMLGKPNMAEIVSKASSVTSKGGVVLLSPGSSSFDMFASYKERGNLFREEVEKLI